METLGIIQEFSHGFAHFNCPRTGSFYDRPTLFRLWENFINLTGKIVR